MGFAPKAQVWQKAKVLNISESSTHQFQLKLAQSKRIVCKESKGIVCKKSDFLFTLLRFQSSQIIGVCCGMWDQNCMSELFHDWPSLVKAWNLNWKKISRKYTQNVSEFFLLKDGLADFQKTVNCHVWFKIKICLLIANLRLGLLSGCVEPSKTKAFLQLPNISNGALCPHQENVRQWLQPHPLLALFASTLSSSRTSPPLCRYQQLLPLHCHSHFISSFWCCNVILHLICQNNITNSSLSHYFVAQFNQVSEPVSHQGSALAVGKMTWA